MDTDDLHNGNDNLYQRIAAGDQAAFSRAFSLYRPRLVYYARQYLEDWSTVDDVVSEAFLLLWQARGKLQSDVHLRNYLFVTVRYRLMKYRQDKQRHEVLLENISSGAGDAASADAGEVDAEMMHLLHNAVKSLPAEYQRIFELSYEHAFNSVEIARILQINAATIRTQKRRAVQLIRDWIQQHTVTVLPIVFFSGLIHLFKNFLSFLKHLGCFAIYINVYLIL